LLLLPFNYYLGKEAILVGIGCSQVRFLFQYWLLVGCFAIGAKGLALRKDTHFFVLEINISNS